MDRKCEIFSTLGLERFFAGEPKQSAIVIFQIQIHYLYMKQKRTRTRNYKHLWELFWLDMYFDNLISRLPLI